MNKYRTHTCSELTIVNSGKNVVLSGWINKKRDHGNLLFIDLRDNYGMTQCIIDKSNENFKSLEKIQLESVIKINGKVVRRIKETINTDLHTGEIEVNINSFEVLGTCKELPMPVFRSVLMVSFVLSTTLPFILITLSNCIFSNNLKFSLLLSMMH